MIKSKRWPWLTQGWEVVEDTEHDRWMECAREQCSYEVNWGWLDIGYVYVPYYPFKKD